MALSCDYCQSACAEGAASCERCGAPLSADASSAPDYRFCPHCQRRLLALGSPACNYCGRNLPAGFVKAREAMLQRINEASSGNASPEDLQELEGDTDDALRRALRSLFDLDDKLKKKKR
jgi:DNA-directed RNA polymerase subunit RPC12/RpoP